MERAHLGQQPRTSGRVELDELGVSPEEATFGGGPVELEGLLSGDAIGRGPGGFEHAGCSALVAAVRYGEYRERRASFRHLFPRDEAQRIFAGPQPRIDDFAER